jgi:UDP:flavonoid glycosyltransferase YjiC (YdhE family)
MTPPRSYLFVTFEGGGNIPAVLGLVRRLTARGHEVRVLTEPCLRSAVEGCGAELVTFTRHFIRDTRTEDLARDWQPKTPIGALRRMFERVVFGPARIVAEETRDAIQRRRPDVVVADLMMPAALFAAEAAGIPRVVAFHTPEYLPGPGRPAAGPGFLPRNDLIGRLRDGVLTRLFLRQLRDFLPPVNEARAAVGLRPLATPEALVDEFHRADLRLIQTSKAFDFPIVPAPSNVRYSGPVLDDPDWTEPWVSPWADDDPRPLVVASFSTTFQNQRDVLQRTISALGRLDVRGLVTLGPCMAEEPFEVPENVAVVASASHAQVFRRASAVVTHAGHGTVMRALVNGVPLLCLPMGRDQDDNAARVVAHGAGLRLPTRAGAARIAAAVERLLAEPDFRMNAERLGGIIAADVAEDVATRELEALALRRTRQAARV